VATNTATLEDPVVKLGAINHLGLVVENIEKTAEFYATTFGIGPFTSDTYYLKDIKYRGKPSTAVVRGGFAYHGNMLIELVEVVEGPTPHTEFFDARGEGVQHIAFEVEDMESHLKKLAERGIHPIFEYKFLVKDAPVTDADPDKRRDMEVWEAYLDTEDQAAGVTIQLMELKEIDRESDVQYFANPND
jgi:catechol 2,3-dioxygenase-like lactoylglutathione lyase family enzyme